MEESFSDSDIFFTALYGSNQRYESVKRCLNQPPSYSSLRINYNPSIINSDVDPLEFLKAQMESINDRLQQQNRQPYTVHRHQFLPCCIIIPSAPPPLVTTNSSNNDNNYDGTIVVDRRCGESILLGADIFAKGILGCTRPLPIGSKVRIFAVTKSRRPRGSKPEEFFTSAAKHSEDVVLEIGKGIMVQKRHDIFHHDTGVAVEVLSRSNNVGDAPPLNALIQRLNQFSSTTGFTYFAQTLPSMVASVALHPKEGEIILDMCASPGGKSTHLASLMNGKGTVIALDKTKSKVLKIQRLSESMGYENVIFPMIGNSTMIVDSSATSVSDLINEVISMKSGCEDGCEVVARLVVGSKATAATCSTNNSQNVKSNKRRKRNDTTSETDTAIDTTTITTTTAATTAATTTTTNNNNPKTTTAKKMKTIITNTSMGLCPNSFDKILLDPPCSALGQRPRLENTSNTSLHTLAQCADYQMALVRKAIILLKPGGELVYSTCTHNVCENELVVANALHEHPNLKLVPLPNGLNSMGSNGISKDQIKKALDFMKDQNKTTNDEFITNVLQWKVHGLSNEQNTKVRRFDPDGPDDSIGFFVAKFVKTN
jgi:16S rRNA C967 or C1407 C5-methylase (RsmB/RsmF family)